MNAPDAATTSDPASSAGSSALPGSSAGAPAELEHDPTRRAFFLEFGKQAVTAAGQVAGMADMVGRTGGGISSLLGLDGPSPAPERPAFARSNREAVVSVAPPPADDAYRSAYRVDGREVVLLDQRRIPEAIEEVVARRGSDVAYYLRLGVARGGPVMAQVAAYGLALTALERASQGAEQRDLQLRRTERALIEARPSSRLLAWSMERMRGVTVAFDEATPGDEVANGLRAEADAIADDFQTWNAAISSALAEELAREPAEPITVLLHGDHGALHGGILGSGIAALTRLRDAGRAVQVYVTEARPFMDGARLASWELRGAGIEHKVLPDSAAAWLLQREPVDAVLINAEWVAANGDVSALVGARGIAQLAGAAGARVIVSGVSATVDPSTPDGTAIPVELLPARDLVAYLADVPVRTDDALVPAADIIPAASISTLVTERGSVTPADAA